MTVVAIANGGFTLNGVPTYAGRSWQGHRIEGMLFNNPRHMPQLFRLC